MWMLLTDENFNREIITRLLRRITTLTIFRVRDLDLIATDDRIILDVAAEYRLILLTHDRKTMIGFAYERITTGQAMPGVIVVRETRVMRRIVEDLQLLIEGSTPAEYENQVIYIPF